MKTTNKKTWGEVKNSPNLIIDMLENNHMRLYELNRVEEKDFFTARATHFAGDTSKTSIYNDDFIDAFSGALFACALTYSPAIDRAKAYSDPRFSVYVEEVNRQLRFFTDKAIYYSRTIDLKGYAYEVEGQILDTMHEIFKIAEKEAYTENYYSHLD